MPVEAVNNVQSTVKPIQNKEVTQPQVSEEKQGMKNETKLLLGSLAALAIGGVIYVLTRGKGNKAASNGSSVVADQNVPVDVEKPVETLKEYTIQTFKEAGHRFENGIAKTSEGECYAGIITNTTKNSEKYLVTYENGILKKSEKYDMQTGKRLWEKSYIFNEYNGKLSAIMQDGKVIFKRFGDGIRTSNGFCGYNADKSIIYVRSKNGAEKYYEYMNGKRILRAEKPLDNPSTLIFYRDDGTKEFALRKCSLDRDSNMSGTYWNGIIELYDQNGNFIKTVAQLNDTTDYQIYRTKYQEWWKRL